MTRTDLQLAADRRAVEQHRAVAQALRRMIDDAGVTQRRVAALAGLAEGYLSDILAGTEHPTLEAYHRIAAVLNADVSINVYPNAGPRIRDRWQALMGEELLRVRHPRWDPYLEPLVTRPVEGWVDLALHERRERVLVATELQSEIRRFEQLVRWAAAKAQALPSWEGFVHLGDTPRISQLVIVRRTRVNRQTAAGLERQIRAAFPAHPDDAIAALKGASGWPGAALAWMVVDVKGARLVPGR